MAVGHPSQQTGPPDVARGHPGAVPLRGGVLTYLARYIRGGPPRQPAAGGVCEGRGQLLVPPPRGGLTGRPRTGPHDRATRGFHPALSAARARFPAPGWAGAYGVYAPPRGADLAIGPRPGQRPVGKRRRGRPGRRLAKAAGLRIPNVVLCVVVGSWPSASSSPPAHHPPQACLGRRSHEPCVRGGPESVGVAVCPFLPTRRSGDRCCASQCPLRRPPG